MNIMIMKKPNVPATVSSPGISYHPTVMYRHPLLGLLTFHAIKQDDGDIDLFANNQDTADSLGSDLNEQCGYVQYLDTKKRIVIWFGFGHEWFKKQQRVQTTYSYEASCMPWLFGYFHKTGQVSKEGFL